MRSLSAGKRIIFVTDALDERRVNEAKFKLADLHVGYGKFDKTHYWSLAPEHSESGYQVLKSLFQSVKRF